MSELIDRRQAIKAIGDLPNCYNGFSDTYDKAYIIGVLEELPTIDAVPVKLIENCIYTWAAQARRFGSGRESTCFEMMAEAAKTILQIHADSQKIKMPTDGVKTVQFKKWKMFEPSDLTNPKPITEEDV